VSALSSTAVATLSVAAATFAEASDVAVDGVGVSAGLLTAVLLF